MPSLIARDAEQVVVGVDDDFRVREAITSLVESAGYACRVFSSAEEFLQSETLAGTSCLITDVRMSGMDGIELQRRARLVQPDLPIIFISAHRDDDIRQQALDGGAVDFMFKPFDAAGLLGVIDRAVKQSTND
jgi:FixJ family two-component response regulator